MKTENNYRLLILFSVLCLIGLAIQGFYLRGMNQKFERLQGNQSEMPASIEERLEARLGTSSSSPVDPTPWAGQFFNSDPFSSMRRMQQQMDSLLNSFSSPGISQYGGLSFGSGTASLNLIETEDEYQVYIQTPPDHDVVISTELEANLLTVRGTVTRNYADDDNNFSSSISSRSQFTRSFDLPKAVDELGIYTEQQEEGLIVGVPKK